VDTILNSETATETFAAHYGSVRSFDPHNVPKLLYFMQQIVIEFSRTTEHFHVDLDG
jgi:hypothetical protein